MATSRGALKPSRTVPPRTSTTCTSMSSPMRIVSPTLRVSVSTSTPPWVLSCRPWRRPGAGARRIRPRPGPPRALSAQGAPDRMVAVGEHHLAGAPTRSGDGERSTQVRRRGGDVTVGHGHDAVQVGLHALIQPQLGTYGPGQGRRVVGEVRRGRYHEE